VCVDKTYVDAPVVEAPRFRVGVVLSDRCGPRR
jgi:hypothetical protein